MVGTDRQPSSPPPSRRCAHDLGVDQHHRLVARFGGVHHDHALVHVDLGGRQAHALGGVHGLEHVVDQLADAVVDGGHGLGHGVQAGSG
jgi:hypothetical protein